MEGWVSLHRKILDNPIVCKDSDHYAVWGYLILKATHQDYNQIFKGEKITLKAGQLITGRKKIAEKFKINESKVQRILKLFEKEQQIEQQSSNANRLITILNWGMYQKSEQQIEQPVNNECTTNEQPVNTYNNNITKKQNNKKIITNLSTNVNNLSTNDLEGYQQKIKDNNTSNNNIINNTTNDFSEKLYNLYAYNLKNGNKTYTIKRLKTLLKKYTYEQLEESMINYFEYERKKQGGEIKDKTFITEPQNFYGAKQEKFLMYMNDKEVV